MPRRTSARKFIKEIHPHVCIPDDQDVEAFGPVKTTVRDAGGKPIRRKVIMLLHWPNGDWSFVRQVEQINNGHTWPAPPFMVKATASEAHDWLKLHQLAVEG